MSDQTPDLAALEALAEAIDGEWACSHDEPSTHRPPDTYDVYLADGSAEVLANLPWELAAYIAAADPQTVLWLIREVKRLEAEVERLTRWQSEAMTVMDGLQELGVALGLPIGARITGPAAVEAATTLRAERDALAARIAKVEALVVRVENRMMATAKPEEIREALREGE